MTTLHDFFAAAGVDRDGLARWLDGLGHAERVAAIRSITPREQAALWQASDGHALNVEFFVPPQVPAAAPVVHHGCNSLPKPVRPFQKVFIRPAQGKPGELYGYNEGFLRPLVGPGYYVAHADQFGSVVIDYYMTPDAKADGWPEIRDNNGLIAGLVYGKMHDHMRRVSKHVSIGRATKKGKVTNNYFVLCREDR